MIVICVMLNSMAVKINLLLVMLYPVTENSGNIVGRTSYLFLYNKISSRVLLEGFFSLK